MPRSKPSAQPVKAISAKLGKDELVKRLQECCEYLEGQEQLEEDPPAGLAELAESLVRPGIIGHREKLVRLYAAKSIAEVLRVYAPEAPYADDDLREILVLFVSQLRCLTDCKGRHYSIYVHLIQNLARFNTFLVRTDKEIHDVMVDLCSTIFTVVDVNQEIKVTNAMMEILLVIVREVEITPKGLVECLLLQLVKPSSPSYKLAALLIRKASSDLEPSIRQSLVSSLHIGEQSDSEIGQHTVDILYQLSVIDDSTLTSVLPQLESKLKSINREERLQFTVLLGSMFSAEKSNLVQKDPALWQSFLGRFQDIDVAIRTAAVDCVAALIAAQPSLIEDIAAVLHGRCHDIEEKVRLRSVTVMLDLAQNNLKALPEQLLQDLRERMLDRKWSVREVAIQRLANLYNTSYESSENKSFVSWIPSSILSGYFRGGAEDRDLIGVVFTSLLLRCEEKNASTKAERMATVFSQLDLTSKRVFGDMMKTQALLQKNFKALLLLAQQDECSSATFSSQLAIVAKSLPKPQKLLALSEDLQKCLQDDPNLLSQLLNTIDPEGSSHDTAAAKKLVEVTLQSLPKVQQVVMKVAQLCCPCFVDADCVAVVVRNVKDASRARDRDPQFMDALVLLETLSLNYSVFFSSAEVFKAMLAVLQTSNDPGVVCSCFRIFCNIASQSWPSTAAFKKQLGALWKHAESCAQGRTPAEAKQAVRCLKAFSQDQEEKLESLYVVLVAGLELDNPNLPTVLSALREIAQVEPNVFGVNADVIILEFAIKQVLRQDVKSCDASDDKHKNLDDWCPEEDLPNDVKVKIICIQLLGSWLLGQTSVSKENSGRVLAILHGILFRKGNLNSTACLNPSSLAHIRLAAAKVYLKLVCKRKDFSLSLADFLQLSLVSQDSCKEVRLAFLEKLNKGLATCLLPLSYMAILSHYGADSDRTVLSTAKKCIQFNVERRRKLAKDLSVPKEKAHQLQPEFCIPYAIYLLAHHPLLSRLDLVSLDMFKDFLWFLLEPIVKDGECHGVLYRILTSIKQSVDAQHPKSSEANKKLYAMCDLAHVLIGSKATGSKVSGRQEVVRLPKHLYSHNSKSEYRVTDVFLPPGYISSLQKSARSTPLSKAYGSPQRLMSSKGKSTPKSNSSSAPSNKAKAKSSSASSTSSSKKVVQNSFSSQDESPRKRPARSKGSSLPKRRIAVEEDKQLSTISEMSEGFSFSAVSSMGDDMDDDTLDRSTEHAPSMMPAVRRSRRTPSKRQPILSSQNSAAESLEDVQPEPKKKMTKVQAREKEDLNKSSSSLENMEQSPIKKPAGKTAQKSSVVKTKRRTRRR